MIISETITIDNRKLIHTYSDANRYIVRDGIPYEDAIDMPEFGYTYTEGDLIPSHEETPEDIEIMPKGVNDGY